MPGEMEERVSPGKLTQEVCRKWKQGKIMWEECRDITQVCRNEVRKAKAQMELNLAKNLKGNKKAFHN